MEEDLNISNEVEEVIEGQGSNKTYMLLDSDNVIQGFYNTEINEIPKGAIEITKDLWNDLISLGQAKLINKKRKSNFIIDDFEKNVVALTEEEKKQEKINELKAYLYDTQEVVIDSYEAKLNGEEIDSKTQEILDKRKEIKKQLIELNIK